MKTKLVLLISVFISFSVITARSALYSENSVGYVNIVLKPGFNLISNPLKAPDNRIRTLFSGVPNNTRIYTAALGWTPSGPPIDVGQGIFVRAPIHTLWTRIFSVNE